MTTSSRGGGTYGTCSIVASEQAAAARASARVHAARVRIRTRAKQLLRRPPDRRTGSGRRDTAAEPAPTGWGQSCHRGRRRYTRSRRRAGQLAAQGGAVDRQGAGGAAEVAAGPLEHRARVPAF